MLKDQNVAAQNVKDQKVKDQNETRMLQSEMLQTKINSPPNFLYILIYIISLFLFPGSHTPSQDFYFMYNCCE